MNRRQRILTSLSHAEADRVPISFDINPDSEKALCAWYGARNLEDLYLRTGIEAFSVWNPRWAALPVYVGPRRPGISVYDSTYGCWGKDDQHIYPLANEDLQTYRFPRVEDFDFSHLQRDLQVIRDGDHTAASGHCGPGWLHHVQMRSYNHCPLDVLDDAWMEEYLGRCREFFIPYFNELFANAGGLIDLIRADEDLGGHDRMMISPGLWRKWYKPLWREILGICKQNGARIWLHSCGYCRPLIPDFIEMGVDVLNPLPPYVKDSEASEMKARFGAALAFDGGVDQMRVLVGGTPQQVREEVRLRIQQLAPGGGYLLGPSQVITADIPLENLVAMFDTALEFGQYPLAAN